jgi:Family of unknown function (DUF6011)
MEPNEDQQWMFDQILLDGGEPRSPGELHLVREFPEYWARVSGKQLVPSTSDTIAPRLQQLLTVPSLEEIAKLRDRIGRKFEADDMTPGLRTAARKYLEDYDGTFEFMVDLQDKFAGTGTLSDGQAKGVCNVIAAEVWKQQKQAQAQATETNTDPVTEPGIYYRDGSVYRVQRSQAGRLYPLLWDEDGEVFDYESAKGSLPTLHASDAMTLEQAEEFGRVFGICVVCNRTLTDPASVERGIGPVCAKKW